MRVIETLQYSPSSDNVHHRSNLSGQWIWLPERVVVNWGGGVESGWSVKIGNTSIWGWQIMFQTCRFELINRGSVLTPIDIQGEILISSFDHFEDGHWSGWRMESSRIKKWELDDKSELTKGSWLEHDQVGWGRNWAMYAFKRVTYNEGSYIDTSVNEKIHQGVITWNHRLVQQH